MRGSGSCTPTAYPLSHHWSPRAPGHPARIPCRPAPCHCPDRSACTARWSRASACSSTGAGASRNSWPARRAAASRPSTCSSGRGVGVPHPRRAGVREPRLRRVLLRRRPRRYPAGRQERGGPLMRLTQPLMEAAADLRAHGPGDRRRSGRFRQGWWPIGAAARRVAIGGVALLLAGAVGCALPPDAAPTRPSRPHAEPRNPRHRPRPPTQPTPRRPRDPRPRPPPLPRVQTCMDRNPASRPPSGLIRQPRARWLRQGPAPEAWNGKFPSRSPRPGRSRATRPWAHRPRGPNTPGATGT